MDAPFNPRNKQLVREAKIGLTICVLLAGVFFYVAWNRIYGNWEPLPEHVKNAPVAQDMAKFYKAERLKEYAQRNNFSTTSTTSGESQDTKTIVAKTVPQHDQPITFNDLRGNAKPKAPKSNFKIKPVKFESEEDGSFRPLPSDATETKPSSLKPNTVSDNNPFLPRAESKRHVFNIEEPNFPEPTKQKPPELAPTTNDFKIIEAPPEQAPESNDFSSFEPSKAEPDLVPLSTSSNSMISAKSTFQVQVEPAESAEPVAQKTSPDEKQELKQQLETSSSAPSTFKPLTPFKSISTPALAPSPQLDPLPSDNDANEFAVEVTLPEVSNREQPLRLDPARDPDGFLNAMPTSPTSLQPENQAEKFTHKPIPSPTEFSLQSTEATPGDFKPTAPFDVDFATPKSNSIDQPEEVFGVEVSQEDAQPTLPKTLEVRRENAIRRGSYLVSENETLWSVAQVVYEDGRLFRALYEVNRHQIDDPNMLPDGLEILTPPLNELVSNWHDSVPVDLRDPQPASDTYITKQGDTLFHVARIRLGQASRFDELLELNRSKLNLDAHHLTELPAGMKLKLPINE